MASVMALSGAIELLCLTACPVSGVLRALWCLGTNVPTIGQGLTRAGAITSRVAGLRLCGHGRPRPLGLLEWGF
jgi:hypothetical protein